MATSAFKSTSRRATAADPKAAPAGGGRRRSHSVSAVSRRPHLQLDCESLISTDFSNSRENPLFWGSSSSPPGVEDGKSIETVSYSDRQLDVGATTNSNGSNYSDRGRSATRSAGNNNGIGRSLSRARERSVSKAPYGGACQNQKVPDVVGSASSTSRSTIKKIVNGMSRASSARSRSRTRSPKKYVGAVTIRDQQALERLEDDSFCSLKSPNLYDGISFGSLSEAEEKTIKPVCEDLNREKWAGSMPPNQIYETVQSEVRRAISDIQIDLERTFQRNSGRIVSGVNVADIPSDLADPAAVQLITDIRREYATKLEESEARARKLRADLAVEEHRGQELGRILKEIVPDPMSSGIHRSRRGRRASNERRRMSKRLSEEAMTYFDECVSLSTFDSSDFSAPEDPLYSSVGATLQSSAPSLVKGSTSTSCTFDLGSGGSHQEQLLPYSCDNSSTHPGPAGTQFTQFSFTSKTSFENTGPEEEDIRSCIKNFERGTDKDSEATGSHYDAGEYNALRKFEDMLVDRVVNQTRIRSGGLLLCGGGGGAVSFHL